MTYKIRKLRNKDEYIVKDSKKRVVLSKHESLADAKKEVDNLNKTDFQNWVKTIKFPVNPFTDKY